MCTLRMRMQTATQDVCDWCGHIPKATTWLPPDVVADARKCIRDVEWVNKVEELKEVSRWLQHRVSTLERFMAEEHAQDCAYRE